MLTLTSAWRLSDSRENCRADIELALITALMLNDHKEFNRLLESLQQRAEVFVIENKTTSTFDSLGRDL